MRKIAKRIGLLLVSLLLIGSMSDAGTTAPELRSKLERILEREGYLGHYRHGQQFQRAVSAYLWDHRQQLTNTDFHNARQLEVLTCLMLSKGYGSLADYSPEQGFADWCNKMLRQ